MRYKPSESSDKVTTAVNRAYGNLTIAEKQHVDRQITLLKRYLDDHRPAERSYVAEQSLVELVGKLGMWINKKEQHKITKQ
jgi:hypothetical protein